MICVEVEILIRMKEKQESIGTFNELKLDGYYIYPLIAPKIKCGLAFCFCPPNYYPSIHTWNSELASILSSTAFLHYDTRDMSTGKVRIHLS